MDVVTLALAKQSANSAIAAQAEPFIVTCTPTAADYSGTMDHTVAEIYAAHQAGKQIVMRVIVSFDDYLDGLVTDVVYGGGIEFPSFNAFITEDGQNLLIVAKTDFSNDGSKSTYSTKIYSLTAVN